ncbi:hypothetical protein BDQ12DRAFT_683668 [Crucibulum laeve]|uniref:Uncharacterized protein n=1 Tax=Crucibulum laeve TaxID=68775 RepID=A0A5C3LYY1_9AGAR|nr:hypothetical protein BDQ12DRAFT_683668 [Crucibulum laeve]
MPAQSYYQLGGYRPHITWKSHTHDDKALAKAITAAESPLRLQAENALLELVLGIKPTGSSHLLITEDEARKLVRYLGLPYPKNPYKESNFESLSPILFTSEKVLAKKLSTLKPKPRKPGDTSQANKLYQSGKEGEPRGMFEHGRNLYHILQNTINKDKFALQDTPWSNVRIGAIVWNTTKIDDRPYKDRIEHPKVLDLAWAEASKPDITPKLDGIKYFYSTANSHLNQGTNKMPFRYGEPVQGSKDDFVRDHLQPLFNDYVSDTDKPLILLVHEAETTLNVLKDFGIDISRWKLGIKDLAGPYQHPSYTHNSSRSYGNDYNQRRNRPRSRSRSPRRYEGHSSRRASYSSRRSPHLTYSEDHRPRAQTYAPVYVVDVKLLYRRLMQTDDFAETTVNIARALDIADEPGWCAGNEAPLLIDIWRSMISGLSIDEQRALRYPQPDEPLTSKSSPASHGADGNDDDDDDDEVDPNSLAVNVESSSAAVKALYNPIDPDSESDYGEDSD